MTSPRNGSPARAVVLGGGGAVGVGWQTGLLTGLREAGVDLAGAEAVLGTSAGALVGALLASGRDVADALGSLAALGRNIDRGSLRAGNDAFLSAMRNLSEMRLASPGTDPRPELSAIGRAAQEASTLAEDAYLSLFGTLEGTPWPAAFRCTAIDADTGDLVVWDKESGVPLLHAVASSCVVPMLFPVVTIKGRRYMDGGILSHLNATAVPPTDVVVVLSAHPLGSKGAGPGRGLTASDATANAELAQLRETRQLIAVEPDFSDLNVTEGQMMDPDVAIQALQIGKRQAKRQAAAIQAAWWVSPAGVERSSDRENQPPNAGMGAPEGLVL